MVYLFGYIMTNLQPIKMGARKIIKCKEGFKVMRKKLWYWIICGYKTPFGYYEYTFKSRKLAEQEIFKNPKNYIL